MPYYRVYDIRWTPPADAAAEDDAPVIVRILGSSGDPVIAQGGADTLDFTSAELETADAAVPFHRIIDNTIYGSTPGAEDGGGGTYVLPEIDDEALVAFEPGDALL